MDLTLTLPGSGAWGAGGLHTVGAFTFSEREVLYADLTWSGVGAPTFETSVNGGLTWDPVAGTRVSLPANRRASQIDVRVTTEVGDDIDEVKLDLHGVGYTLERLYARLPEFYRVDDEDRHLLTFLHANLAVASAVERVQARLDPAQNAGVSDLVSPDDADDAWLPWLAQHLGVQRANLTSTSLRELTRTASSGWRAASARAIASAAATVLTGSKYVRVMRAMTDLATSGTMWDILVVTRTSETNGDVVAAVNDLGARPAGFIVYHDTYETSWAQLETSRPTWADIDAAGSWTALEETGL